MDLSQSQARDPDFFIGQRSKYEKSEKLERSQVIVGQGEFRRGQ